MKKISTQSVMGRRFSVFTFIVIGYCFSIIVFKKVSHGKVTVLTEATVACFGVLS